MKRILTLLAAMLTVAFGAFSQSPSPGVFNYQGVARNSVGNVLINKNITLRLTIHDGSASGATVYQESRNVTTNPFGLFNVQVGSAGASNVTGTTAGVNWGVNSKFIQVEIDPNGGTSFINIGTAQIASVPYALYSSLSNDLVLPFNKSQNDAGSLFKVTNTGTAATSAALEGVTNSTAGNANAILGTVSNTSPGGFSAGVRGINNGTGGLGIGVYGSQNGSGWGVYGTTPSGIGVNGISNSGSGVNGTSSSGTGVSGVSNSGNGLFGQTTTGRSLRTIGAIQHTGINEGLNRVMASDASGNGTWQDPATIGLVTGSGTLNFVPKWTPTGTNLGNSQIFDDGTQVGVGTTTPFSRLTVVQNNSGLNVGGGANTGTEVKFLGFGSAHMSIYNRGNSALTFAQTSSLAQTNVLGTELMTLTSAGNLGIGTNAPSRRLHVVGGFNLTDGSQSNNFILKTDASGNASWVDPSLIAPGGFLWTRSGTNMWNTNLGDNVAVGTISPTHKFTVSHGGSTGIGINSTSGFSVLDIDAASGDAAIRLANNGVNQWNMRNRPGDNYLEFFELGGGGSRMVIQDATGNVGIGETANPTYKLDVLHGGSTGIRSRSSSSFSVVDIDAASGDAALRFQKAGTGMWNTRNRPADDYYEIFELGGGGSRMVIQDATGNVGIGETANPTYKLDVLHGGSTGIRSRSSSSFSVVDIDAASGDAALRFAKAGVNQWNIRNRPADDYLEIFELGGGGSRMVIQDATGNVGIGETANPTYKLDVLHGGSTGIRSRSSSSFSVVDIDAASGDAALRFQKAGVGVWNTRNRPADDYYEIFELGGGGSRMVIQNGTGNVGIGETTSPSYKLDVLHDGSTGIRSRSSSSFSVIDIDGASGDAALRFAKAGVNQWNIRNRPADDYLEIFELGGGGSRMVIQDGTGNVGIGETTNPTYKLDVLHGGATGIRSRSSSTFSLMDIDAANGDAALRFAKAGVNQWNIRNNPATDDLQIFELGGGGERMRIDNTTGQVVVSGDFTAVGVKAFTMDHPLDPGNKILKHAAAESNEVINFYSGNIVTDANGKATVQLPDYFDALNKDPRYQLTVIGAFAQAIISKEVSNNQFEIATNQPNVKVSWEVKGVRNDARMQQHPFVSVEEKTAGQKGKYIDPASHNQPASKGLGYDSGIESSLKDMPKVSSNKPAPATTGGSLDQAPIVAPAKPAAQTGGSLEEMPKPKTENKPAQIGGSIEDVKTEKPAVKPADKSGSVIDQPVEKKIEKVVDRSGSVVKAD